MSEPVTEIVSISLSPGTDLSTGEHQKLWTSTLETITSQPGCTSLYWGHRVENPAIVQMVVDWESLADHRKFEAQPYYQSFLDKLSPLLSSAPSVYHIHLPTSTPFSTPGSAPVTECASLYFQASYSPSAYSDNWKQFRTLALEYGNEANGVVGGWSIEQPKHEDVWNAENGEEGPSFAVFIGWPSLQAHMEFRETEEFQKIIPYARDGPKGGEFWHVEFKKFG